MTERLLDEWARKRMSSKNFYSLEKKITKSTAFSSTLTIDLLKNFESFVNKKLSVKQEIVHD